MKKLYHASWMIKACGFQVEIYIILRVQKPIQKGPLLKRWLFSERQDEQFFLKKRWCFSIWRKSSSVCPMWTILFGKKMVLSWKKCPKFYTPEFSLNHHLNKDLHRWKKYFPTLVVINKIKELFVAKDKKGKLEFLIIIDVIGFFCNIL